ncbi:AraC family transcriptional regulator [Halomonas sp. GFAJ-1]|uniref:AraC family transcriptional regulator n=1 Tax=Halomonas sp. GFAJ-1 TaxID=1118153 RepID=UPI00023A5E09|nr:AraC family transcriptional regulator [Halomonas sp. GFAJ-1]AVI62943.1 AraC family transcriptional regulator [Halomonas sp. GFAJ-1]EHK61841.1 AraC type helix-turn-helix- domain containing protein [Halomonas sp. GFAJ-1]
MAFISFSTNQFEPEDRLEAAQEAYGAMANVELHAQKNTHPDIQTRVRLLPGVSIAHVTTSSLKATRGKRQVTDGNDDITFLIHPGGSGVWQSNLQSNPSLLCVPGSARVVMNYQSGSVDFQGDSVEFLSVAFSRSQLAPFLQSSNKLYDHLFHHNETLNHITRIALDLTQQSNDIDNATTMQITRQLFDLACLTLGSKRSVGFHASRSSLKKARLKAIKIDINTHFRLPLSLDDLALRHKVSTSYIRSLFRDEGTSFTDYLLEKRLTSALNELTSPSLTPPPVQEVAFRSGFNNLSWFYNAFKARFGMPPGEARELAQISLLQQGEPPNQHLP